jgi:hypothetical protein
MILATALGYFAPRSTSNALTATWGETLGRPGDGGPFSVRQLRSPASMSRSPIPKLQRNAPGPPSCSAAIAV